ncbi:hypothetical protein GGS24DRAFT_190267 [Hypoxylon argillaceum]|nr:hypothetical protein GGS24DRAFT_190267 [Hypoxylon argillaceum]
MAIFLFTYIFGLLIPYSTALQVTPNSPCASFCLDSEGGDVSDPNSSTTTNQDITCLDSEYGSSAKGLKFQRCISCLQDSAFSQGSESDQLWFLYNLRYAFDNCIFGFPNVTGNPSTPCSTSTACGVLRDSLTAGDLSPTDPDYSYCDVDGGVITSSSTSQCMLCVGASSDQGFLVNYLVALEAGCNQRPAAGAVVGLSDTVFSATQINAVDTGSSASKGKQSALPTTTIVGIAVGAAVVILAIAGFFFVRHRKRRNRRLRLEGDTPQGSGLGRGQHRASELSFRCQTHLTPRSPAFPNHSSTTIEEEEQEKSYSNPHLALGSHPITLSSPILSKSTSPPTSWEPQSRPQSFCRPRPAPQPLQNISVTTAPAFPEHVHYSTSPRGSRFSPRDETPTSTTSTRSTAQLLPLRPYNPAEYGVVASPHVGSPGTPAEGGTAYGSPVSASTASPLLSRLWEGKQGAQGQEGMAPIWEMPQQQQQRESALGVGGGGVAARRGGGALERMGVPLSPGRRKGVVSGSPVESTEINTVFPGPPPSPGSRWRR